MRFLAILALGAISALPAVALAQQQVWVAPHIDPSGRYVPGHVEPDPQAQQTRSPQAPNYGSSFNPPTPDECRSSFGCPQRQPYPPQYVPPEAFQPKPKPPQS